MLHLPTELTIFSYETKHAFNSFLAIKRSRVGEKIHFSNKFDSLERIYSVQMMTCHQIILLIQKVVPLREQLSFVTSMALTRTTPLRKAEEDKKNTNKHIIGKMYTYKITYKSTGDYFKMAVVCLPSPITLTLYYTTATVQS